jgi:transposase InsO family protein
MVATMSRQGNGWDHAVSESFFATLKAEEATEPYATKQEAHRAIAESIHGFYNPSVCTHHTDIGLPTSMRADCNTSIKTHLRGPSPRDHFKVARACLAFLGRIFIYSMDGTSR